MNTELYSIKHFNNRLDVFKAEQRVYNAQWFMEFGKFSSEVFNSDEKIIFAVIKKFQFWKWKMVFTIKESNGNFIHLISQNTKKTIFSIDFNKISYRIKIHFKKKMSIYKNENKIAEIDESFLDVDFTDQIKLQLLDQKDLEICFLLFSCLKIGEIEQRSKAILKSQKQLEVNEEPWS